MNFHLSPDGDDANDGLSAKSPWATLAGCRDALRKLRAADTITGHVSVRVGEGTYRISEFVPFGPEDGHTAFAAAPGASPVIDGGRVLSGWTETTHNKCRAWTLDLPEVASGYLYFRSLFVSEKRRPRARYPKFSPDVHGAQNTHRIAAMRFPEKRDLFAGDHMFKPTKGDMQDWPSLHDAEIVLLHYWVETRLPNPRFHSATGWVSCSRRSVFNLYESFGPKLARYYIDNLFEALTEPGEWYLDRNTGRVTYLPLPGESISNTIVAIPLVTRFIEVTGQAFACGSDVGDPLGMRPVENLAFEGLTFRHSDWYQPSAEMLSHDTAATAGVTNVPLGSAPQSAAHVPAVIQFQWARNCRFEGNTVEHTGFTAIGIGNGCRDFDIAQNTLQHLGGGGVKIAGSELNGPPGDRTGHIRFTDNTVLHVGRVFHQSCGILLTHAFDCDLLHNDIAHTCYTGISCGWSWGYRETITRNIRIENNHVHNICEGVLSDNGAIYLLGVQPGTLVRGNHIHHVTASDYGGWGIYPDEGSSHIVFEHNWIHDTQGSSFAIHFSRELILRHNVFARAGESLVGVGRVENHIAANLSHNLLLGPAKSLYSAAYRGDIRNALATDANVIAFAPENVPPCTHADFRKDVPRLINFVQWQAAGNDQLSLVTPIKYTETATTFTLPKNSPALKSGFRLYDWSACGPRIPKN
ncbi:MAG: right-handed parallel beta-helix repeat-containing protein [Luteolibacter sp.]